MKTLFLVTVSTIVLSCAHHKDVRPGASGIHSIKIQTENKSGGYPKAKAQADHYCEESKRRAFIEKEGYQYTGSMDEKSYNNAKMASKVAKRIGGAGYVLGGKRERDAGGVIGVGGGIADSTLGSAYTYSMTFRCK